MKKKSCHLFLAFTLFYCCLPKQGKSLSGDIWAHDPSSIIKDGNKYWVFTTGDGINAFYSTDLLNWKHSSKLVFNKGSWPAWIKKYAPKFGGVFWAPDVVFMNGNYYLYYSCSSLGSPTSAIGVATTPTLDPSSPAYNWTDLGMVVTSSNNFDINAIDPSVFKDANGKLYLTYGSYSDGIGVIELDAATGKVKTGANLYRVAGGEYAAWEAGSLIKEGDYYYLFANRAHCCNGAVSTYYIVAGRSTSPTGPFFDKNGINLRGNTAKGGGTPVMVTSGKYVGPGHFGLLRDNGRNIVSMHYYDANDNGNSKLDIANLEFTDDGWPIINRNYLAAGRYKITDPESKLVMEAPGCGGSQSQQLILNTDNNSTCQEWDITPIGNGYYKISNQAQNYAIDVPFCNASNGVNLQAVTWLNNNCQKFKIELLANGRYVFTSLANYTASKVIQYQGAASPGTPISLFDYNGSTTQQWTISRLSAPTVLAPTDITDTGFTAKWTSGVNDSAYRLDVFTTFTNAAYRTIAGWNFQSGTNGANTGLPANLGKPIVAIGTDIAVFDATGNGGKTAQATGWDFSTPEKYWEINITTANYYNLKVSSKQRSSVAGPRHFKLQYKIGENGTYADIPEGLVSNLDNYTAGVLNNITLPEECENQHSVYLRWLLVTSTNLTDVTIQNSGQSDIDDIIITGNPGNFLPGYNNLLVKDTSKRLTGLPPGTDFFFRVRSIQGSFTSVNSEVIKVTTNGVAPLRFTNIGASEKTGGILVNWEVSPENNIIQYEVEKSLNGRTFTQIAVLPAKSGVRAAATSVEAYNYLDVSPSLDDNFYRIKAIMQSGVTKYSLIAKVFVERGKNGVYFYPNPSNGKTINMHMFNEATGINNIQLVNSLGQVVYKTQVSHSGGSLNVTLQLNNVAAGVYNFRVTNGSKMSSQKMLITNR